MNAYWSQWSYEEILSMHGIELEEEETEPKPTWRPCECGECMSCLGMSWRDFF